ncbi:MAG: FMN-binding protein [Sphaerochaeta sp.]|nr:FMN-binding protein [Sphaerochaeta sp.]
MKRRTLTLIILLGLLLLLPLAGRILLKRATANLEKLRTIGVETPNLALIQDGTYRGSYARFPLDVTVGVDIRKGKIVAIELLKHRNGEGQEAESIPLKVIESQSLDIDAVSGATYSSIVILKAIEDALSGKGRTADG